MTQVADGVYRLGAGWLGSCTHPAIASACAFALERRGVLFSGDGLVTAHPWKEVRGPQLNQMNEDREQAIESLDLYGSIDTTVLLPGLGDPWSGKTADAVRQAKSSLQQ